MKSFLLIVIASCLPLCAYANVQLFDYRVIIEAQKSCNDSKVKNLNFLENRKSVFALAQKSRVVISDLTIKEVTRKQLTEIGKTRSFVVKYKIYAQLGCGKQNILLNNGKGTDVVDLPFVYRAWKHPNHVDVADDNRPEIPISSSLGVEFTANDLPPEPGLNGLGCIIEKVDFLTESPVALAKKMCGKGASKAVILKTVGSIQQAQSAIRKSAQKVTK